MRFFVFFARWGNCEVWFCNCSFYFSLLQGFIGVVFGGRKGMNGFLGGNAFLGGGSGEGDGEVYVALGVAGIPWEGYVVALVG